MTPALLFKSLTLAGCARRLSVLIFHRVHAEPDPVFPDEPGAHEFEQRLRWLSNSFRILPLAAAVEQLRQGTLPARSLCITFDDGYADNHDVAMPVLRKLGLPATFFITTGFLDGGRMWNDSIIETVRCAHGKTLRADALDLPPLAITTAQEKRTAIDALIGKIKYLPMNERLGAVDRVAQQAGIELPRNLMMSTEQVRAMHRAGMGIGAHTVHHPILTRIDLQRAREEISTGRAALEKMIDAPVNLFAYPNGRPEKDYGAEHVALVRELGFSAAVSTGSGAAKTGDDLFQIPRFTPWQWQPWRASLMLARNLMQAPQVV